MVTTNHVRAPKVDQRQTTNREALIHENVLEHQAKTVGTCSLLAWGCSHPHLRCLVSADKNDSCTVRGLETQEPHSQRRGSGFGAELEAQSRQCCL